METIVMILQFILSFSLLIIVHEFGHFMFARMFGIRVEKFYLFFDWGFSLFKFNYKGTEYGMGWVPFGGYVKIAGMIDESMDTEQMNQPAKPDEFRSKPAWQRLLVMTGGVLMNIVLAIAVYIGMTYHWGDTYLDNRDVTYGYAFSEVGHEMGFEDGDKILSLDGMTAEGDFTKVFMSIVLDKPSQITVERGGREVILALGDDYTSELLKLKTPFMEPRVPFIVAQVGEGSAAEKAGLMAGDRPVAVNGEGMRFIDQIKPALAENKGRQVDLTFERDSAGMTILTTVPIEVSNEGMIGIMLKGQYLSDFFDVQVERYTLLQSIPLGISRVGSEIAGYWKQLKLLVQPKTGVYKEISGPIGIAKIFPGTWSWFAFWRITAFLSIVLAVMNILPIPALDGGHVVFLLYEMITGRKPNERFMEVAQVCGMLLLFGLLILVTGNDIYKLIFK